MNSEEPCEFAADRVPVEDLVRGERGVASVSRAPSLQTRASSVLAGGLTMVLGVAALAWYYANALTRPSRARDAAQAATAHRAQGEMPLPSLGRIDRPVSEPAGTGGPSATAEAGRPTGSGAAEVGSPARSAEPEVGRQVPVRVSASPVGAAAAVPPGRGALRPYGRAEMIAPEQATPDRRLSGTVFARQSEERPTANTTRVSDEAPRDEHGLAQLLRPTATAAVQARILPTRRFLLPKGSFIDCTLETAIDSTLPGMTTCVAATDTFSADGSVVLLERGTRLIGETRGEVRQGTARVFVLWTEARTPTGVVVPLDSPGTDELGRSGLQGSVDRHFWARFGSAILITAINGAVQAAVQPSGGTVIYNPSASQEVLTEVLRSSTNIPPTVRKNQGDRIQVFVARDVDFRSVYDLHQ